MATIQVGLSAKTQARRIVFVKSSHRACLAALELRKRSLGPFAVLA